MMPPPSNAAGSTFRLGGTLTIPRLGLGDAAAGPMQRGRRRSRHGGGGRAPLHAPTGEMVGEPGPTSCVLSSGRTCGSSASTSSTWCICGWAASWQWALTPIGERFAALADLRDEGLIRHLRISNVTRSPVVVQISGPAHSRILRRKWRQHASCSMTPIWRCSREAAGNRVSRMGLAELQAVH
jgi:hypothetical protein